MTKRKNTPRERFVRLDHALLMSDAWLHLSPYSAKLLICLWLRYDGRNNGQLPLSMREAMAYLGCGRHQAIRAFRELVDKGFVRVARDAAFNTKKTSREWTITALPVGDQAPTRDFEAWSPGP